MTSWWVIAAIRERFPPQGQVKILVPVRRVHGVDRQRLAGERGVVVQFGMPAGIATAETWEWNRTTWVKV